MIGLGAMLGTRVFAAFGLAAAMAGPRLRRTRSFEAPP
jgi:hypothetical protein